MNVLVMVPYLYDTVPGQRFRLEQWAGVLERRGVRFRFEPFESPALKKVIYQRGRFLAKATEAARCMIARARLLATLSGHWDVIVVYRELLPIGPPIFEWLLARTGRPIVYDFDDAIFVPDVSEANRHFAWLKWPRKTGAICRLSTHIIVGNEYLRQYAAAFNPAVTVVPTTIDDRKYLPTKGLDLHDPPVVGWTGSLTTIKHLETIVGALRTLRQSVNFRLKVVGATGFRVPGVDVECVPWSAHSELAHLSEFDIGLMPLPDDQWSRGKCGLKALQCMALGIPVIVSPVGVNSQIVVDGHNGFLASTESEWVEKMSRLLGDAVLRRRFASEGRKTIERHYSAEIQAPLFLKVLKSVCRGEPDVAPAVSTVGGRRA
jgi:glycosyltransferase involved in cell wall biosynthesis